jgi:hypothetical protein
LAFVSVLGLFGAMMFPHLVLRDLPGFVFRHAEFIGIGGTLLLPLLLRITEIQKRPFSGVPWEGRWWEFLFFGAFGGLISLMTTLLILCAGIVLPIIVPLKALRVYVLGPTATLFSAFVSMPIVFLTTSLVFAIIYVVLIDTKKGNLVRAGQPLYSGIPGVGWSPLEALYFSVSTMVKGSPQYEASGWCRWVAILEVLISRLLELATVTVGFNIILRHDLMSSPHP